MITVFTTPVRSVVSVVGLGLVGAVGMAAIVLAVRADAASESSDATFVAVTSCRLFDTRPESEYHIGPLSTFGTDDIQTAAAHGTNGDCTLPADAVAVSLNVTAVNASAPTHLTVWPAGPMPRASSLNPVPGEVAFNAVTVPLVSGGFNVYNLEGSLDVIADVNGYYVESGTDELDRRLDAVEAARPVVVQRAEPDPQVIDETQRSIVEARMSEPAGTSGTMVVSYSVNVEQDEPGAVVECSLGVDPSMSAGQRWESPGSPGGSGHISGSATFSWGGDFLGAPAALLFCMHSDAVDPTIATNAQVTMTFHPDPIDDPTS